MKVIQTRIKDVLLIEAKLFKDPRGFFMESWQANRYAEFGIPTIFLQDNVSYSSKGVLRGLHFQNPEPQGKLVTVLQGEIYDVAVDLRAQSATFGKWVGATLSAENNLQLWVPEGFAHGFCVTSDNAMVSYKCTRVYAPKLENTLLWNDPELNINWPKLEISLSDKDEKGLLFKDLSPEKVF